MTTEIPIVTVTADPVAVGLAPSLAHPGGNITGVTVDGGIQLNEKRIQLLKELVPNLSKAFYLVSQPYWEKLPQGAAVREAAEHAGISLAPIVLGATFNEMAYESAFQSMEQQRADALLPSDEAEHVTHGAVLVNLVAKSRLPAMFPYRELVDAGGLIAYSIDLNDLFRHAANQIASILKGAKPQDIPFYQPTKFQLVINMKTAKSLGIDVRGRSSTLRINYRTSHQIRQQADRLLGPVVTDVDGISEDRSDTVSVIDTATNQVVDYVSVGSIPTGVTVAPNGSVYVTNAGGDSVSVLGRAATVTVS